ncbi:hypothetical protein HFO91_09780 [Rhizobium leguminosarum]|uniref:hypothetical protein n=1 Tax=Rhizobium leguminosarum TaxID=384 RepID=UPI001C94FD40|nr:hypothetical protein [Rhizobium leguminosarum]MBY5367404.1 hypothetical protein [Rhizobium leguminosarum]MBY5449950.1 hypothetical protein [Rhizobium leguminosarum]
MIFKNAGTIMPVWNLHRVDPGYVYITKVSAKLASQNVLKSGSMLQRPGYLT